MSIDASTGLVTWSPTASQTGTNFVTVLATDQFGGTAQQKFAVSVLRASAGNDSFDPGKLSLGALNGPQPKLIPEGLIP